MKPDIQPKEAKRETKALPKLANIAITEINKNLMARLNEVVVEAAEMLGIRFEDGWQYDPQAGVFVREVK